ncbi:MAG: hypothetical protein ACREM3_02475 [Candidatus Rokuibacteriota bacterium]
MRLAARGARETESGTQPVADPEEARLLKDQARRVVAESIALGALLTGLGVLGSAWLAT